MHHSFVWRCSYCVHCTQLQTFNNKQKKMPENSLHSLSIHMGLLTPNKRETNKIHSRNVEIHYYSQWATHTTHIHHFPVRLCETTNMQRARHSYTHVHDVRVTQRDKGKQTVNQRNKNVNKSTCDADVDVEWMKRNKPMGRTTKIETKKTKRIVKL